MSKVFKSLLFGFSFVFALAMIGCNKSNDSTNKINLTFNDSTEVFELVEGSSVTAPSVDVGAGEEVLGWALDKDAIKAKFTGNTIKYEQVKSYAKDGSLKLYSVVEAKIEVTMKGISDTVTKVSNLTLNTATIPLVEQNERQKFIGWALTSDAKDAVITSDQAINYNNVKDYANNAKVTLYPVVINYDLMICIHASHSNGNIYVSTEQQAEIVKILNEHFKDKGINILVDRIDGVSATNFAKAAVEKDYDLIIGSKSVVTTGDATGDIITASQLVGKNYDVEADSYTTLEVVDLNQSRRVGKVTGSEYEKPYQDEAYQVLTAPVDKTIEVTFSNGLENEVVIIHRAILEGDIMVINNESYLPTNESIYAATDGKVFNGWALDANSTEQVFASVSYQTIYKSAVDGKITVYPVYKNAPDLCVLVWGVNGSNVYITEDEYNTILNGFTTYLADNQVDVTGKEIEIIYYQGKTEVFKSELTKSYVNGAIGASALNNDDYATYWTINSDFYAKVTNVTLLNEKRYIALRNGSENNSLAVLFYRYLTEHVATVSFDGVEGSQALSSYEKNVAVLPTIEEKAGLTFVGWATTADATSPLISSSVELTYATVESLLKEGTVKLYPVYVDSESLITYDLVVYVLKGNSSNVYITPEEAINAISEFKKLEGNSELVIKLDYSQQGAGADFLAYVNGKGDADIVIGASNLNPEVYTAEGFSGITSGKVINSVFTTSSSRYLYIYNTCNEKHLDNAIKFLNFMCDKQISVTIHNGDDDTNEILSSLQANVITLPTIIPQEGYQFDGWKIASDASEVSITANITTINYAKAFEISTNGKLDLYPVTSLIPDSHTCGHVCSICGKCTDQTCVNEVCSEKCLGCTLVVGYQTKQVSEEALTKIQDAFTAKLTEEGLNESDVSITWKAYTDTKAQAVATAIFNDGNCDVVIAHPYVFNANQVQNSYDCSTDYAATTCAEDLACSNYKVGVGSNSDWNRLAKWLYEIIVNYQNKTTE